MDPDACFRDLLDALAAQQWDQASALGDDLTAWLDRGGFPPRLVIPDELVALRRALALAVCRFAQAATRRGGVL